MTFIVITFTTNESHCKSSFSKKRQKTAGVTMSDCKDLSISSTNTATYDFGMPKIDGRNHNKLQSIIFQFLTF